MHLSVDSAPSTVANPNALRAVPNNLGPTLLLVVGFLMVPLLIGVPLLVLGLALLRSADGTPALPALSRCVARWRQASDGRRIDAS